MIFEIKNLKVLTFQHTGILFINIHKIIHNYCRFPILREYLIPPFNRFQSRRESIKSGTLNVYHSFIKLHLSEKDNI